MKQIANFFIITLISVNTVFSADSLVSILPLAKNAAPHPIVQTYQLQDEKDEADRVRYSVLIGSRDFPQLEKEAAAIIQKYDNAEISGDEFITTLFTLVPINSGLGNIRDLIAWTEQYPKSYAAWYVLGRQYLDIAQDARGGKWASETSEQQFAEMDKYARLSEEALLESVKLYDKALPSYRALLATDHYIQKERVETITNIDSRVCNILDLVSAKWHRKYCTIVKRIIPEHLKKDDGYLRTAAEIDPNSTIIYIVYFSFNTPRWGGNFDNLAKLIEEAKNKGMNQANLAALNASLLEDVGTYLVDIALDHSQASEVYEQSFNAAPELKHVKRLYLAAAQAKKANDIDRAIALYTKIIELNPKEYHAFFKRGDIYKTKNMMKECFSDQIASAMLGFKYAQNNIGYFYLTGDGGFPKDLYQARAWLQLSANQGYDHARKKLKIVEEKIKNLESTSD